MFIDTIIRNTHNYRRVRLLKNILHTNAKILFRYNKKKHTGLVVKIDKNSLLVNFMNKDTELTKRIKFTNIIRIINK